MLLLSRSVVVFCWLACVSVATAQAPSVVIGRFAQETPEQLTSLAGQPIANTKHVFLDHQGKLHLVAENGHFTRGQDGSWQKVGESKFPSASQVLAVGPDRFLLASDNGIVQWSAGGSQTLGLDGKKVNSISKAADGSLAAATDVGVFESKDGLSWNPIPILDSVGRQWAARDVRAVVYDAQGQLWVGQLAGLACRTAEGWKFYEGRDGLPYADFTCAAAGADGKVWFGTRIGVVIFDQGRWLYRQGRRFLPGDEVRSIVITAEGTPWIATDGGLGILKRTQMTLAEKARFYEQQIDQYIKRTPYGYTSEVQLKAPADLSEIIYSDSDNDGLWTAMYGASQCYAVAVTQSAEHKAAAKKAFDAIRFLQTVTQGGSHSPPKGYIARTILPTDGHNPNDGRLESDRRTRERGDRMWKLYEPRWPTSADGKWYWKSDTSSDELDGHYFFLPLYYDLVADTDAERDRVREVVRDLTDHLIDHNFVMIDIDGKPTRWAIFNPENLNQTPVWWVGRGLNSLSILSYLAVAYHITGDDKYQQAMTLLREKHSYEANAMVAKVQFGVGSGNQSDDEMAMMNFYSLIKYAPDDQLRRTMLYSMYTYWRLMQPERNPFFHFCYAALGISQEFSTPFRQFRLDPWPGWLEDSMQTLVDFPLDRLNWSHRNSHRLDIVYLPRQSHGEPGEGGRLGRGHLVDGKVLPVENRHFNHWNTDPWRLDYSGDGRQLASGTVFLLPYYMGRYHGFIDERSEP